MNYLIQGFLFELEPEVGTFMFAASIRPAGRNDGPAKWVGSMQDHLGVARLHEIEVSHDKIHFCRDHQDNEVPIDYFLIHQEPTWVGAYGGCYSKYRGKIRCIVTEVQDEIFVPPPQD